MGTKLWSVIPGIVLISIKLISLSLSIKKSTLPQPLHPSTLKAFKHVDSIFPNKSGLYSGKVKLV